MTATIDMRKLGLRPHEMRVMKYAVWAAHNVKGGRYLCSDRQRASAKRLIDRGYLTKARSDFVPPKPDWIVVRLTRRNIAQINSDYHNGIKRR